MWRGGWLVELEVSESGHRSHLSRDIVHTDTGLIARSRRPLRSPNRVSVEIESEIVAIRKDLVRWGHEAGAATIAFHLTRRHGRSPAVSTIWRILTERGFVTPQPHKRPKSSYVRFEADQPNERWQADTATMLSDNGAVFTGRYRGHGRVVLEVTLAARGISFRHSRPYHPQTCGKVERFHQTVKKWLAGHRRAASLSQLQRQLDDFRRYYNTVRPHRALGRLTPAETYAARPKAVPTGIAFDTAHYRVRHDTIDRAGKLTLRHNSRLHHIGIGRRHASRPVLILVKDLHVRITTGDGELLRDFELDPTRDYQQVPKT